MTTPDNADTRIRNPDLISLVISLRPCAPIADGDAPAWWGRAAHALLLKVVEQADPALAAGLHEGSGPRPFTASSLLGRFPARRLDPQESYLLRLTAIQSPVAGILLRAAGAGGPLAPGATLELAYQHLSVETVCVSAAGHPWAGASSYPELAAAQLVGPAPAARQISLSFTSPTAFRSQDRHVPLPLPELVFGSLLERWNAFSPLALPAETKRYAAECLAVSRFDLTSRPVQAKEGGLRVGGIGQITYVTLNYDRYWMSVLNALAAFALFSGVGVSTATGLGQCRQLNPEE
jgi:CRISPR-associated endoribonuclease Cas6